MDIVTRIESQGVTLKINGDKLRVYGNYRALSPEQVVYLRDRKAELIRLLRERETGKQSSAAPAAEEHPSPSGDRQEAQELPRTDETGQAAKKVLAVDLETTGLDPRVKVLRLVSFAGELGAGVHDTPEPLRAELSDPSLTKVFHNAPFDVPWLQHLGYTVQPYEDTMLMEQALCNAERRPKGGYGLAALVKKYFDIELDKSMQGPENWEGFIFPEHREYSLKDAQVTLRLYHHMDALIREKHYEEVYAREARALPAIIRLQRDGMPFDAAAWKQDLHELQKRQAELDQQIQEELKARINLASPPQLLACLNSNGIHLEDTTDETLALNEHLSSVIPVIRSWRALQKLTTGFGKKLLGKVRNGRIYSSWRLLGAATGRMSCSGPNLQQIPHELRQYFKPSPGCLLIICDYSQIELRLAAEIAGEEIMLQCFRNGEDLHKKTARMILQKEEITKGDRQLAKACNFGLLYGMGADGFRKYAEVDYGVKLTTDEAMAFREGFFKAYPGLKRWHRKQWDATAIGSLGGRIWQEAELRSPLNKLNYPVQASAAEGMKNAMALIMEGIQDTWRLCAVVHDEVIMEVPAQDSEKAARFLEQAMINGMQRLVKKVPIVAEALIAESWKK